MSFSTLGLSPELLRAIEEKGYAEPTPIQSGAIPAVLAGRDVLAAAQTGTGKTAAFVLPILQRLSSATQGAHHRPRALVLTPTRELAAQVADNAAGYGRHLRLRTAVVFGGVGINPQIEQLRRGCDLLIATPGRLLDLHEQGALHLDQIECFVLDEADRMLDMGFIHAIRRVLKLLPPKRQNLMFSATYSDDIRGLAGRFLRDPISVEIGSRNSTAERVEQCLYRVPKDHKRHLLAHLILEGNWQQVLVFTRTKHGANRLAKQLEGAGIAAAAIHGNKSQSARVRALEDFKNCRVTALVATEVAARGLDIKELPHVVNYELPNVPEDYVHRIGRTARAGSTGSAVSLVAADEAPLLRDIEKLLKRSIQEVSLPKFALAANAVEGVDEPRGDEGQRTSGAAHGRRPPHRGVQRRGEVNHGGQRHASHPDGQRKGGQRREGQYPGGSRRGDRSGQGGGRAPQGDRGGHAPQGARPDTSRGGRQSAGSPPAQGRGGHVPRGQHPQGRPSQPDHRGPRRDSGRGRADGGWRRA